MWDSKTLLCCSRWTGIYLVDLHTGEHRRPPFDCGPEITTMMTDSRKEYGLPLTAADFVAIHTTANYWLRTPPATPPSATTSS